MPKLTLITSTYRSADYLQCYFDGVLALEGLDDLVVAVLMNAPDTYETELVTRYASMFPKLFRIVQVARREPIFTTFNRALNAVDTPYVAWLAVDDMRPSDSLVRQMATLEKNPDVDITYGDFLEVRTQGDKSGVLVIRPEMTHEGFLSRNRIAPTVACRVSLIRRMGGFDEQYVYTGDGEFQMRAVFAGARFRKTEGVLYHHTSHAARGPHPNRPGDSAIRRIHDTEAVATRLRYGQYHMPGMRKRAYRLLTAASRYRLDHLLLNGEWKSIDAFLPGYRDYMARLASRRSSFEKNLPLRVLLGWLSYLPQPALSAVRNAARRSLRAVGLLPAVRRFSILICRQRSRTRGRVNA